MNRCRMFFVQTSLCTKNGKSYNQLLTTILVELEDYFNVYMKMSGQNLLIDYDSLKFKSFELASYKTIHWLFCLSVHMCTPHSQL
jgi:hypothetical protein